MYTIHVLAYIVKGIRWYCIPRVTRLETRGRSSSTFATATNNERLSSILPPKLVPHFYHRSARAASDVKILFPLTIRYIRRHEWDRQSRTRPCTHARLSSRNRNAPRGGTAPRLPDEISRFWNTCNKVLAVFACSLYTTWHVLILRSRGTAWPKFPYLGAASTISSSSSSHFLYIPS